MRGKGDTAVGRGSNLQHTLITAFCGKQSTKHHFLGYGSNMSSKVLSGRRQVFPKRSVPVIVHGYQLTYDMPGFPYLEPGFGTIQPVTPTNGSRHTTDGAPLLDSADGRMPDCQVGSPLHCVAHLITQREMDHIVNTEGGNGSPDFGYQLIKVPCQTYEGERITGVSLIDTDNCITGYHPSVRYQKIIVDGAVEHGLAPEYIERLRMVTPYRAKTIGQRIGKWVFLAIALPLTLPVLVCSISALVFKTKVPWVVSVYGEWVKRLLWLLHDYIFASVFGKGC
ncbi:hypothetical protein GQ54DRAFT_260016 [Martensiomyces pterosporus]|nr:hypothetical protein GQ54DRAFT_260016 [Martensiomyces pterosporus]